MASPDKKPEVVDPVDGQEVKDAIEGGSEQKNVMPKAEHAMGRLHDAYNKTDLAEGLVDMIEDDIDESTARIEELRSGIGLDGEFDGEGSPGNSKQLEALAEEQSELKEKIDELETLALDLPPDLDGMEQSSDPFQAIEDLNKWADNIENNVDLDEKTEEELKEMRKKAVERFIEDSTEHVLDHFKDSLNEVENEDKAVKIIELKTASVVGKAAEEWINTGENPDFGFIAYLKMIEHESPNGDKAKFVTGYVLEIQGKKEKIGLGESEQGERFIDKKQPQLEKQLERERVQDKEKEDSDK